MTWVALDDQFFSHPKTLRAGRDARDVFLVALGYCGQHLTDGYIPEGALPMIGSLAIGGDATACAAKLVEVGLWELAAGGWQVHDYLKYQPSKSQVEHRREKTAERQANFRTRHAKPPKRNGVTNALRNGPVTGLPSHPIERDTKGKIVSNGDVVGAKPSIADDALSSLCSEIAQALGAEIKVASLKRLMDRHPTFDASRLIFEAEMAADWIANPQQNIDKKTASSLFFHNWLRRAERDWPLPSASNGHASGNGNGRYYAAAEPRPLPDGRGIPANAKPGKLV